MSKQTEALKLALEALEYIENNYMSLPASAEAAITAIREALALVNEVDQEQPAQQEQEPVAWMIWTHGPVLVFMNKDEANLEFDRLNHAYPAPTRMLVPLYTSPPAQRKPWVGLTDEDIDISFDDTQEGGGFDDFARAIEAKLKEKNSD